MYALKIDLGTTCTAVAVRRGSRAETCALPTPGTPASRGVAVPAAERGSSRSRWLLPTVSATLTLMLVALIAFHLIP